MINYLHVLNTLPITKATADYVIEDSIKQTGETRDFLANSIKLARDYIGPDTDIRSLAATYKQGATFQDPEELDLSGTVESSRVFKMESDRSKWSVGVLIELPKGPDPGDDDDSGIISQVWSSTMAQYQYPLEKYLNGKEAFGVASWDVSDPFIKLSSQYEYSDLSVVKNPDTGKQNLSVLGEFVGELKDISERAVDVSKLKWAGVDSVMKFYPQVTLTTVYTRYHHAHTREKSLGCIDTYPNRQFHQESWISWLKTGFDWTENTDGSWTLVESWMGAPKDDGGWDRRLYGESPDDPKKWKFYDPTEDESTINPKPPDKYEKK